MLAPICNFAHLGSASYEGDARLVVWILAWDNHVVLDRVNGWFDANSFYPAKNALVYAEHLFGISVFTLPIYWLTRNPVLAYNLVWILSFLLSAVAAHALAWRYTRDHVASLAAGVAYGFCFFRMHHAPGHLQILWGFWIPVWLIALDRWMERLSWTRWAVVVAVGLLQALASWYQAVMTFVAGALFVAWAIATGERLGSAGSDRRAVRRVLVQSAMAAAAAFATVWPFARRYVSLPSGGPREALANSADLAGYLISPENTFAGHWLLAHGIAGPRWIWGELTVYLGWTVLLLAVAGAAVAVHGRTAHVRRARFLVVLAAIAVALAFGPSPSEAVHGRWGFTPFGLFARIPGFELFRVPARFSELLTLALAVLAAVACASLRRNSPRAGTLATFAALPLMLAEFYVVGFPGGPPQPYPVPQIYRQVAALPPGAIVSLPDYSKSPEWFREADYQLFFDGALASGGGMGTRAYLPRGISRSSIASARFPRTKACWPPVTPESRTSFFIRWRCLAPVTTLSMVR